MTNRRQETETPDVPEMLRGRPQTSWAMKERRPSACYRSQSGTDLNPFVFFMLFSTFPSSHAAAYVKALSCHAIDLNLTSSPGDKLNVGVKPMVSLQGS